MSWNTRREKTIQRQVEQGVVTPFIQKNTDAKFATRTRPGAEGSIMSATVEGISLAISGKSAYLTDAIKSCYYNGETGVSSTGMSTV